MSGGQEESDVIVRTRAVPEFVEPLAIEFSQFEGIVFLPDSLSEVRGELTAGFRPETQAMRVAAMETGASAQLALPEGSKPGHYSENSDEVILPLVLNVPFSVFSSLVVAYVQHLIEKRRNLGRETRTIRYREVRKEGDSFVEKEIEGPPSDVMAWIEGQAGSDT